MIQKTATAILAICLISEAARADEIADVKAAVLHAVEAMEKDDQTALSACFISDAAQLDGAKVWQKLCVAGNALVKASEAKFGPQGADVVRTFFIPHSDPRPAIQSGEVRINGDQATLHAPKYAGFDITLLKINRVWKRTTVFGTTKPEELANATRSALNEAEAYDWMRQNLGSYSTVQDAKKALSNYIYGHLKSVPAAGETK